MERSEESSKNGKGNQVTLVNPNILRFSCMSVIEDGNIPEWLLVEVLLRLPVKSVFRFKLVSKKWFSVISDPYFVRLYVSRASLLSSQPWTIVAYRMYHRDSQFSSLDYELLKDLYVKPSLCVVRVPSIHQPQEKEKYLICGISNGLVSYERFTGLSLGYADRYYYICNPLTGHCIALPPAACRLQLCGWGFHTRVEDGFLKSYRMVLVDPPTRRSNRLKFQVYVSEIGEWKDFNVPSNLFPVYIDRAATVVNGILHWITEGHGIIAYDPYQNPESMRVIAFPGDIVGHNDFNGLCVEDGGKLRYIEVGDLLVSGIAFPSFKVWVLNDYSSGEWYLQHNISHVDVQYDANFPSERFSIGPICFHPFDSDIVYLACDDVCVSYNIRTRKLQVEEEFFRHRENVLKRSNSLVDSFLFVIPHWPTSIPRPSYGAIEG